MAFLQEGIRVGETNRHFFSLFYPLMQPRQNVGHMGALLVTSQETGGVFV